MFRILIVDDERIVLNGVRMMIEEDLALSCPTDIATASNGPQALDLLKNFTPDLILTDIRMPVMDGFTLVGHIREQFPDMGIAILTSHADFDYAVQAIRYQVTDFILKPIDENQLKETIEKAHKKKEQAREAHLRSSILELRNMMLYDLSPSELISSPEQIRQLFPYTYFTVIVAASPELTEKKLFEETLQEIFSRYYDVCHCFLIPDKKQIAAICNHEHFSVKAAGLKRELADHADFHGLCTGISISSNTYKTLHSLYTNAVQRIFYKKSFGENPDITGFSLVTYHDCIQIFNEKDPVKVLNLLQEYIRNTCSVSSKNLSPESVFCSFFHNICLYLESVEISLPDSRKPIFSGKDDFSVLPEEIFENLSAIKQELQQTSEYQNSGNDTQIQQLLDYIRKNYQNDISLDNLADAVKMHPNYVCTLFKKHIGQSYLFCLHQERLRAAKQLLIDTDFTIEEIARQVGYNSASQLARVFRKYESTSPSDFRSKH